MSEGDSGNWCLIESDPGVFTELMREFGVKGLQAEELWSLEPESFERLMPIHGLIFLFKWGGEMPGAGATGNLVQDDRLDKIFFARQVIQNACATQALISVLMNCSHEKMELGSVLKDFKEFTSSFDPNMKGLALSNSDTIRSVHNSFARQAVFEFDQKSADKDEDVFHFVSYIPIDGRLYELDGLKEGPLDLGPIPAGKDWTEVVRPILTDRIAKYAEGEIHFNLLAIVSDRKAEYEERLADLKASGNASPAVLDDIKRLIDEENLKREKYKMENIRRKHNYLPLIVQFLKELADHKQLLPLYEAAKEKAKAKAEARTKKEKSK